MSLHRTVVVTVSVGAVLLAPPVFAQKLLATSQIVFTAKDGPSGLLVLGSGQTISKKGVVLEVEAHRDDDGAFAGYKYAVTNVDALKSDDQIILFFRNIDTLAHKGELRGFVTGKAAGAWKSVKIDSVHRSDGTVRIAFKDTIKLTGGATTKASEFVVVGGFIVEAVRK